MAHDGRAVSAHCHTDADVAYGLAYPEGHHAVDTNRAEQQSQCAQRSGESDDDARWGAPNFEIVLESDHLDSETRVDRERRIANAFRNLAKSGCIANEDVASRVVFRSDRKVQIARVELT